MKGTQDEKRKPKKKFKAVEKRVKPNQAQLCVAMAGLPLAWPTTY
jgi:hypothetical protein